MQVRFGPFTLDTATRQLSRGNTDRHLSLKGFELLCLLVEHRPRALSKAELHERLWPSTFVSDATLSSLVAEVRSALGEKAKGGHFVRTVHRFGYAFAARATERPPSDRMRDCARCWVVWEFGHVALGEGVHLLGRDADVTVWLESPTISRHHARLTVSGEAVTIEDLGSKNGTFLWGERLDAPAPLADRDEVTLGSVPIRIRLTKTGDSTVTHASGG